MIDSSLIKPQNIPLPNDPSVPNPIPLTFGTYYKFQLPGVVLPTHQHTDKNSHFTIVLSGSFTFMEGDSSRVIGAGDIVNTSLEPHSFISLEVNSIILNIAKHGTSAESLASEIAVINESIDSLSQKLVSLKVMADS